jgi:hypothetical protein
MALCEALYPPLQMAEIALRNSLHKSLSIRYQQQQWYQVITGLPEWQQNQLTEARVKLLSVASALDRFTLLRQQGSTPWIEKIRLHWPKDLTV